MARSRRALWPPTTSATTPVPARKSQKGRWTQEARRQRAEDKTLMQSALTAALAWMLQHNKGPNLAAKEFPELTVGAIQYARDHGVVRRTEQDILTPQEMQKLADWCIQSAANINPAKLAELSEKVVKLLRARQQNNRSRGGGNGCTPLTKAEKQKDLLASQTAAAWAGKSHLVHEHVLGEPLDRAAEEGEDGRLEAD